MRYATPKAMREMPEAEARGEETELRQEKEWCQPAQVVLAPEATEMIEEALEPIMNRLASHWYSWGLLVGWLLGLATALFVWQCATYWFAA